MSHLSDTSNPWFKPLVSAEPRWEICGEKIQNNVDTLLQIQLKGRFTLGTEGFYKGKGKTVLLRLWALQPKRLISPNLILSNEKEIRVPVCVF